MIATICRATTCLAFLVVLLLFPYGEAHAMTGNEWRTFDETAQAFYVVGVYEGWQSVLSWIMNEQERKTGQRTLPEVPIFIFLDNILRSCVSNRMPRNQIIAIVAKYLNDNPARWHEQMPILIADAMGAACK
jgi:hypothetical protein